MTAEEQQEENRKSRESYKTRKERESECMDDTRCWLLFVFKHNPAKKCQRFYSAIGNEAFSIRR